MRGKAAARRGTAFSISIPPCVILCKMQLPERMIAQVLHTVRLAIGLGAERGGTPQITEHAEPKLRWVESLR